MHSDRTRRGGAIDRTGISSRAVLLLIGLGTVSAAVPVAALSRRTVPEATTAPVTPPDMTAQFDWVSMATGGALHQWLDGVLSDDETIALFLRTRWGMDIVTPDRGQPAAAPSDDARNPADCDTPECMPYDLRDEDAAFDGLVDDGLVEDGSPVVTIGGRGFDPLDLVTPQDDDSAPPGVDNVYDEPGLEPEPWISPTMLVVRRRGARIRTAGKHVSELGTIDGGYFLDWPWSNRHGHNMFYWLVGPPALVFLVVGAMGVAGEVRSRAG